MIYFDWKNPENAKEGDILFIIPNKSTKLPKNPTNGARWEDDSQIVREYKDGMWYEVSR